MCLNPECNRECDGPRGLCLACYQTARKYVRQNKATWEDLENAGLATKPRMRGRPKGGTNTPKWIQTALAK